MTATWSPIPVECKAERKGSEDDVILHSQEINECWDFHGRLSEVSRLRAELVDKAVVASGP